MSSQTNDGSSLLAALSVFEDAYPSPSSSGSDSDRETQESPERLSKFKYCVNECLCSLCVCVCVCVNNAFLCVSAWRQEDSLADQKAFLFKGSIRCVYCYCDVL